MNRGICGFLFIIFFVSAIIGEETAPDNAMQFKATENQVTWQERVKKIPEQFFDFTVDVLHDTINFHHNLISWDSLKILGAFTPIYIFSSLFDSKIHKQFYNAEKHKNINQVPMGISGHIRGLTFASAMVLSSLAIVSPDPVLRETSKVFTIGYWSGILTKNLVKQLHFKAALRPWNEKFSAEKQSYGGFPSGHMFEATYMTMVYGLQYGWMAMVPLTAYTASLAVASIIGNRHYTSQVMAGVTLGTLYGLAAHKVIEKNLSDHMAFDFGANEKGDPALTFTYRF